MFTGIIEEVGEVVAIDDAGDFRTIRVRGQSVFDDLPVKEYCVLQATAQRGGFYATASRTVALGSVPEELARAIVDVAEWTWLTGQVISPNGGVVIQ